MSVEIPVIVTTPIKPDHAAKRLARLAAVQGLYQIALTQVLPETLIRRFRADPSVFLEEEASGQAVDQEVFATIVAGVSTHMEDLDGMIAGATSDRLSASRMELLLKAILRAGVFELQHRPEVQAGVIINDYVDIAHSFFDAKEPGLVNALLDRLAKTLRN